MVKVSQLNISLVATNAGADLVINGDYHRLDPSVITNRDDLATLLSGHPEYVYNAVIELLKEML